jgi:L-2-hydroxyglutarate oxidase LhgO
MGEMEHIDALVVGAGVVGLATARALAQAGLEVVILERDGHIGGGVSSRNSEVIHAGHYYDAGSFKARWCVEGRRLLTAYCHERKVPHRICGKLVVANHAQDEHKLAALLKRGETNGVEGLRVVARDEAIAMEPDLRCTAALWSPRTGIVDSHALMTSFLADAEAAGAVLALKSPLESAQRHGGHWYIRTGGDESFEMSCRYIVNAAGLGAQAVACSFTGFDAQHIPKQHLAKGHYFSLSTRSPFSRLIYPLPVDGGLGVHLTLDLAGQARFGPDVEWLPDGTVEAQLDYRVDPGRQAGFEADIRRYWPGLPTNALAPAYSGVRPKISGPGAPASDFCLSGPAQHGQVGVVHLFGIESPGLTSSMAIANAVVEALQLRLAA